MRDVYDYYLEWFLGEDILVYSVTYHVHWRGTFIWVFFYDRFSRAKISYARVRWGEACELLRFLAEIDWRPGGKLLRVVRDSDGLLCLAPPF